MEETLKRLGKVETGEMPSNSAFVKPYTITYEMVRRWLFFPQRRINDQKLVLSKEICLKISERGFVCLGQLRLGHAYAGWEVSQVGCGASRSKYGRHSVFF